jgi:hypothetical protein
MKTPNTDWYRLKALALSVRDALYFIPYREWPKQWRKNPPNKALIGKRIEAVFPGATVREYNRSKSPEDHLPTLVVHGKGDFDIFVEQHYVHKNQEFCIAHELGHYLLHTRRGHIRGVFPRVSSGAHDREATIFAGFICFGEEKMAQYYEKTKKSYVGMSKLVSSRFKDVRYLPPGPQKNVKRRNKFKVNPFLKKAREEAGLDYDSDLRS